jgi:chromosome partitioning protein
MVTRIFAIANQKGGVGKSTTAVNVAAYLAQAGRRTLLVDMDPQGNASSGLGFGRDPERSSVYDVVIEGRPANEATVATVVENLDIIPSDIALAGAEIELINMARRESRLLYALDAVQSKYDYILIDCPPSLGLLTLNALVAARNLLVPIQCEFYALEGLGHLSYTLDLVRRQSNPDLKLAGIVMTLYDSRTTLSAQVVEEVRKSYPNEIFQTLIPRNVRLSEAPSYGLPISLYDSSSKGARAYEALAGELIARTEVPSTAVALPPGEPEVAGVEPVSEIDSSAEPAASAPEAPGEAPAAAPAELLSWSGEPVLSQRLQPGVPALGEYQWPPEAGVPADVADGGAATDAPEVAGSGPAQDPTEAAEIAEPVDPAAPGPEPVNPAAPGAEPEDPDGA